MLSPEGTAIWTVAIMFGSLDQSVCSVDEEVIRSNCKNIVEQQIFLKVLRKKNPRKAMVISATEGE